MRHFNEYYLSYSNDKEHFDLIFPVVRVRFKTCIATDLLST